MRQILQAINKRAACELPTAYKRLRLIDFKRWGMPPVQKPTQATILAWLYQSQKNTTVPICRGVTVTVTDSPLRCLGHGHGGAGCLKKSWHWKKLPKKCKRIRKKLHLNGLEQQTSRVRINCKRNQLDHRSIYGWPVASGGNGHDHGRTVAWKKGNGHVTVPRPLLPYISAQYSPTTSLGTRNPKPKPPNRMVLTEA
jgi:hypothetical protein